MIISVVWVPTALSHSSFFALEAHLPKNNTVGSFENTSSGAVL